MLGFFLGLKCLSDGAQICCWSLSAQDCRVSGPINDLKNVDQFYLSDSAPHPSNKNTVANRNLLSSIIRILTFIPLWRSQLEMISDFFFFLFPALPQQSCYPRGNTSTWHFALSTSCKLCCPDWHILALARQTRLQHLRLTGVSFYSYCPKKIQAVSQLFLFIVRFSAWSGAEQSTESHCMSQFILNWSCCGKNPPTAQIFDVSVPCSVATLWLDGTRRREERASHCPH